MKKNYTLGGMLRRLSSISLLLFSFCGQAFCQTTDECKMTMTRNDDNAWYIKVKAGYADQENAWIDWNNNGTFDGEDEMIDFYSYAVSHDVTSRTITIYGKITELSLPYNKVEQLDVTENPTLKKLFVNNNLLTELNLSGNPELQQLYCYNNTIEQLDLSHNPEIYRVACYTNHIQDENMWNLINSIPSREDMEKPGKIHITNSALLDISLNLENVCTKKQVAVLNEKNWGVYDWNDGENEGENIYEGVADKEKDNYTTDLPKITLTSSESTGKWNFFYDVPDEFRGSCWIDTNGNKQYDEGEEVNIFNTSMEIERTSATLDMYGMFSVMMCPDNKLTSIEISQNPDNLKTLNIEGNEISSLNLSECTNLVTLNCDNNKLQTLDVSGMSSLYQLNCQFNGMTVLNIEGCAALKVLNCSDNELTGIDVSTSEILGELYCSSNKIAALDLSHNTVLRSLYCNNMQLGTLDVSANDKLEILYCLGNSLKTLEVDKLPMLRVLNCGLNQLETIQLDANSELTKLYVYNNMLTSLSLKDKKFLSFVDCCDNRLADISFEDASDIVDLHCSNNEIKNLALDNFDCLQRLVCDNNRLTSLNTEDLISLSGIRCENNQISALNFTENVMLKQAYVFNNMIGMENMSVLMQSLPVMAQDETAKIVLVDMTSSTELNRCADTDIAEALKKGWEVKDNNGGEPIDYLGETQTTIQSVDTDNVAHFIIDSASQSIKIMGGDSDRNVSLYTTGGILLQNHRLEKDSTLTINVQNYVSGTYIIKIGNEVHKLMIRK